MAIDQKTIDEINKRFNGGKGDKLVRQLSGDPDEVDVIPTGSLNFDLITGIGGFPLGRVIELYGPESSGKTTATIHAMVEAQRMGYNVAFVDFEQAFDKKYAISLGVDPDNLLIAQPDTTEDGLNAVVSILETGKFNLIVVDSTNAMSPKAEFEGDMEDSQMGLNARLLNKGLRQITSRAKTQDCCVMFISQIRHKIGVVYGSPEVVGVGNAMKFYCSMRFELRKQSTVKNSEGRSVVNTVRFKNTKNKLAAPFEEALLDIRFGEGFDRENEIIDIAKSMGIVTLAGSWYSYGDIKLGQGKEKARELLKDNEELYIELRNKVVEECKK